MNEQEEIQNLKKQVDNLTKLISRSIRYESYIYNQLASLSSAWDNIYTIDFPYPSVASNSLLLMLPKFSSIETSAIEEGKTIERPVILKLKYIESYTTENDRLVPIYKARAYKVYVETQEGVITPANKGDIISGRLAFFRFINGDKDSVILINSPLYNTISLSNLTVTNKTTFYQEPEVIKGDYSYPLVTNDKVIALEGRVRDLENKISFGTESPEKMMADLPLGSIYIQVEEG